MAQNWPILKKPPVVMVIFQVIFERKNSIDLSSNSIDKINRTLPKLFINTQTNVDFNLSAPIPLGESTLKAGANTEIASYIFHTEDQRNKLEVALNQITLTDETSYNGFESLKSSIDTYMDILSDFLKNTTISRVSIRFINRFSFNEFNDPTDYFKTIISTTDDDVLKYPIALFAFKIFSQISDNTRAIINQGLNNTIAGKFDYLFDIDVLCDRNLIFDKATLLNIIDNLRDIKNELFFSNLTQKTIDLCNE